MASQQLQLICDQSTYANFFQWASAISAWFASCGWLQATDTGQEMWTGLSITAVSMSGSNMTCTYTSLTGLALAVGRTLTITGWTGGNTGNNGTFRITSLGAGTFTAVNASGVNVASAGTGVVTAASAVPGSGAFVYEVWTPGDALTAFYVKMEYGNVSGTNCPSLRVSLAVTTNGAGTVTGFNFGPVKTNFDVYTPPSATLPFECNFSGDSGRMGIMLWRNGTGNCQQLFAIERSLNSSGVPTGTYATLWTSGFSNQGSDEPATQRSLIFAVGASTNLTNSSGSAGVGGWCVRIPQQAFSTANTAAFNGTIPFDTPAPLVGYFDYPCTVVGAGAAGDYAEGVPFTVTLYGNTRTYMPCKIQPFVNLNNIGNTVNNVTCLRYD